MRKIRIGILGATGAVGREMRTILEARDFPAEELRLMASAKSAGLRLPFHGEALSVIETSESAFSGLDLVLGAASR